MSLEWTFAQSFGDRANDAQIAEADILSAVQFDSTGNYIAVGDRGGRVVLFKRPEGSGASAGWGGDFQFYAEFQSHEPEFDYLKSLEIEEKINKIRWCRRQNAAHFLLTTNDKTIKLWKVYEKDVHEVTESAAQLLEEEGGESLRMPEVRTVDNTVSAVTKRVYSNAHAYHINSISVNSDDETYISADDLRVNLWNFEHNDQSFNIVDIKPANMEELTEVITCAEFHPEHCNIFMYSSSRGAIRLGDLRQSSLCDNHTKVFEQEEDPAMRSFFSEIISSISDARFSHDGRYLISRDYMTVKLWDINMEREPVKTMNIHEYLRPKLCDLYENDSIFDKFECAISPDARYMSTGSYQHMFHVVDMETSEDSFIDVSRTTSQQHVPSRSAFGRSSRPSNSIDPDSLDYAKKVLHIAWHPREHTIALCDASDLVLYHGVPN